MKLLTVAEVSLMLRVGESTVYALLDGGKIAGFRVGPRSGGIRIDERDVLAYLERCRTGPAEQPRSRQQVKLKRL
jgi:excisionase family DNA binding protein